MRFTLLLSILVCSLAGCRSTKNSVSNTQEIEAAEGTFPYNFESVDFDPKTKEALIRAGHDLSNICLKRVEYVLSAYTYLGLFFNSCAVVERRALNRVYTSNLIQFNLTASKDEKKPGEVISRLDVGDLGFLKKNEVASNSSISSTSTSTTASAQYLAVDLCRATKLCNFLKPTMPYVMKIQMNQSNPVRSVIYSRKNHFYLLDLSKSTFGVASTTSTSSSSFSSSSNSNSNSVRPATDSAGCDLHFASVDVTADATQTVAMVFAKTTESPNCAESGKAVSIICSDANVGKCKAGDKDLMFDYENDTITFDGKTYSRRPWNIKFIKDTLN